MAEENALLTRFPELIRRCRESRFEVNADSGLFTVDDVHADDIHRMLEDVMTFFGEVEARYTATDGAEEQDLPLVDCSIADLSFLGRLELEGLATRFADARGKKRVWDVLRYADMAGARAEQALIAIETSIREAENLVARDHGELDLGPALEVRRQYSILRYEMVRSGELGGEDLRGALERQLARITAFREHATYAQVRVDDRLQIRSLQKRIRTALADSEGEDLERLWEDLEAATSLLLQINRRSVLENHDRRILSALGPKSVSTRFLTSLLGRSAALDAILLGDEEAKLSQLESLLDELRIHLLADS